MSAHKTRLTLLDVERAGQSFFVTTLAPDGETRRDVYGFWENEDNRPYVIAGSLANAATGHADFGNYDLYIRDSEGRTTCVEMWTDEISKFINLLSLTRRIKGTATGWSMTHNSITLKFINKDGEPDTFTFDPLMLVREWSFWDYQSRLPFDEPKSRHLKLCFNNFYVTDLVVPDELFDRMDVLVGPNIGKSWTLEDDDESPKLEAAATSYTLQQAA
jgi:hypothetical protein